MQPNMNDTHVRMHACMHAHTHARFGHEAQGTRCGELKGIGGTNDQNLQDEQLNRIFRSSLASPATSSSSSGFTAACPASPGRSSHSLSTDLFGQTFLDVPPVNAKTGGRNVQKAKETEHRRCSTATSSPSSSLGLSIARGSTHPAVMSTLTGTPERVPEGELTWKALAEQNPQGAVESATGKPSLAASPAAGTLVLEPFRADLPDQTLIGELKGIGGTNGQNLQDEQMNRIFRSSLASPTTSSSSSGFTAACPAAAASPTGRASRKVGTLTPGSAACYDEGGVASPSSSHVAASTMNVDHQTDHGLRASGRSPRGQPACIAPDPGLPGQSRIYAGPTPPLPHEARRPRFIREAVRQHPARQNEGRRRREDSRWRRNSQPDALGDEPPADSAVLHVGLTGHAAAPAKKRAHPEVRDAKRVKDKKDKQATKKEKKGKKDKREDCQSHPLSTRNECALPPCGLSGIFVRIGFRR